jgi:hypothetical protein
MSVIEVNGISLLVSGKFTKVGRIKDEEWFNHDALGDLEILIKSIHRYKAKMDLFCFTQKLPETKPKYNYYMEWDNVAAIHLSSFENWWEKKLPQVTRKNVRRAGKKGVVVRVSELDDKFLKGIVKIYNETPIRQGRKFWHYGKNLDTVKRENSTFLHCCDFIGAYYNDELIGFLKLVYVGREARIMQIISMAGHQDKRPTNALIAKAVELCAEKNMEYFIYGKYIYGKRTKNSIIEFKDRNGFEKIEVPQYYIPMTLKGRIILKLKLHHGVFYLLPEGIINIFVTLRSKWYEKYLPKRFVRMEQ